MGTTKTRGNAGQNEKYALASALHSGKGKVSDVCGNSMSPGLFIGLLTHLKTR